MLTFARICSMYTEKAHRHAGRTSEVEKAVLERDRVRITGSSLRARHVHKPDPETAALLDSIFSDNPLLLEAMRLRLAVTDGRKRPISEIAHMLKIPEPQAEDLVLQGIDTMNPSLRK